MITTKWNDRTMFEELDESMILSQQRTQWRATHYFFKETNINSGFEN